MKLSIIFTELDFSVLTDVASVFFPGFISYASAGVIKCNWKWFEGWTIKVIILFTLPFISSLFLSLFHWLHFFLLTQYDRFHSWFLSAEKSKNLSGYNQGTDTRHDPKGVNDSISGIPDFSTAIIYRPLLLTVISGSAQVSHVKPKVSKQVAKEDDKVQCKQHHFPK